MFVKNEEWNVHMGSIKKAFDLSGRTALISGGSRGLGLQIAEALGEQGARILISSRKEAGLMQAATHLSNLGISVDWISADNGKDGDIEHLVDEALRRHQRIDILVNNAGTTFGAPAEEYPAAAWDQVMAVNLRSTFLLSQQIAKRSMIPNRYGRIINMASVAGLRSKGPDLPGTLAYSTSKGALINFTHSLADEWGKFGITVNALAPGWFLTKMTRALVEAMGAEALTARTPLRRLGDDEDLKGAALLFASDAGKYITGQTLAVDGGLTAV